MSPVKFPPTSEQHEALRMYATGRSMKIEAGAGTGKTSTLQLLAESDPRRVQYVAFNKAIVTESKSKFPSNVRCNTAHSLAFKGIGHRFQARLDDNRRVMSWEIAKALKIREGIRVEAFTGQTRYLADDRLAGIVVAMVNRWCQTADPEPTYRHMVPIRGLDDPLARGPWEQRHTRSIEVAKHVGPFLKRAWADLGRYSEGVLRFTPAHYLKMWQLDDPAIYSPVIMFDEAQDASPVLIDIVARQQHAQVVWVGDSNQQIYEFTGAVNALAKVPVEETGYLSQSFRFGQPVADVANGLLRRLSSPLQLRGFDAVTSTVEPVEAPKAILTRTNATAVRELLAVVDGGRTGHLVGGGQDVLSFARAAHELRETGQTQHPELWCFESWEQVLLYVEDDEQGGELRLLVKLVEEFSVETIERALAGMPAEGTADVIVSTAHKSKGRQWTSVRLASDFAEAPDDAELRLLYVAVTRAEHRLDITGVPQVEALHAETAPASPQEPAGAPATPEGSQAAGGQHAAARPPENAPTVILRDESGNRVAMEAETLEAAIAAAEAWSRATDGQGIVIDENGMIVLDTAKVAPVAS